MQIGDLIQPTDRMRDFGYDMPAVIVGVYGARYILAFPDGTTQVFHPNHLKPVKK
jgi:hypothetical protein